MDIMPLCIHSSLMNCFNKVIFLCFYNELKFHILSTDGKCPAITGDQNLTFVKKWT